MKSTQQKNQEILKNRADLIGAYKACLDPEAGNPTAEQKLMVRNDLMKRFDVRACSYQTGDTQLDLAFREGGRNAILYILAQIEADPFKPQQKKAITNE